MKETLVGCGRIVLTWWGRRRLHVIRKISDQVWSWSHRILERANLRGVSLCLACHKVTLQCGPINQPSDWRFSRQKNPNLLSWSDLIYWKTESKDEGPPKAKCKVQTVRIIFELKVFEIHHGSRPLWIPLCFVWFYYQRLETSLAEAPTSDCFWINWLHWDSDEVSCDWFHDCQNTTASLDSRVPTCHSNLFVPPVTCKQHQVLLAPDSGTFVLFLVLNVRPKKISNQV